MELQGESMIAAPRATVWAALNDPAVLARCIDGVERLDAIGDHRFAGTLNAKVGPVRAKFTGEVELTELDPPNRYVLVGEGKGGVAGFAKGSAEVTLNDAVDAAGMAVTQLKYLAKSTVGGKLAQLGSRLIEGAARGYAESFFERFKAEVETPARDETPATAAADADAGMAETAAATTPSTTAPADGMSAPNGDATPATRGLSPLVWGTALVILTILVLVVLLYGWPW